jgi:hypothetical protein
MSARVIGLGLSLSFVLLLVGCAGKNVSSSSGDSASRAGQGKTEEIQPDVIKTVPLERSFDRRPTERRVLRLRPVSHPYRCHADLGRQCRMVSRQ